MRTELAECKVQEVWTVGRQAANYRLPTLKSQWQGDNVQRDLDAREMLETGQDAVPSVTSLLMGILRDRLMIRSWEYRHLSVIVGELDDCKYYC
jgi:hypothetical protein